MACRGQRDAMVMAPLATCDSALSPGFHGWPASLHRHFPPQSPPSHLLELSLCSQQQPLPWHCSTIPKFQLPATAPSRVCMAVARTVWFSSHWGCHRSAVSRSATSLTQIIAPVWGSDPCFSSPPPQGRSSPTNTPVFPASFFTLPSFVWVFILFSAGQVLLSTLSWCSALTSMSEGVFLVFMERDVFHVHLLLRHLVLPRKQMLVSWRLGGRGSLFLQVVCAKSSGGLHDGISWASSKQILVMTENLHFVRGLAFKGFALAKSNTQTITGHWWSGAINVTGFPLPPRKKAASIWRLPWKKIQTWLNEVENKEVSDASRKVYKNRRDKYK